MIWYEMNAITKTKTNEVCRIRNMNILHIWMNFFRLFSGSGYKKEYRWTFLDFFGESKQFSRVFYWKPATKGLDKMSKIF